MKRILISIDHKWRDLPGYVFLGKLLEKEGYIVNYCRNGLESFYIQGFQPHIVMINHLYEKKRQVYFKQVAKWGINIVVLPTEGIPTLSKYRKFAAGIGNDLSSVSLHFVWNKPMANITKKNPSISSAKIKVVGVPRFDFYKNPLKKLLISKEEFIQKYNLTPKLPIITFATNYTQAQFAEKNKDFFLQDGKNLGYNTLIDATIPEKDYLSREKAMQAFIQLVKDFVNVNFVLKLHPSEDHLFYFKLLENELNNYQNRVTIIVQEYIWDILSVTDIELKRSCTTGIESWILGHPTIEMKLNGNEWYFSPEHVVGSDIANSYDELKKLITEYLNGKNIGLEKKKKRTIFLNTWCYKIDGQATYRVVYELKKLKINKIAIQRKWKEWILYFLLTLTDSKLHDIKVYGIKNILLNRKIDRLGRIDKHFNNKDIQYWYQKLEKII